MSKNPLNLALRFLLELAAIISFGIWGFKHTDHWTAYFLAFALPLAFALLWGIFAVRGDPSRSGKTVVPTPGVLRLLLELGLLGGAVYMVFDLGHTLAGWLFGAMLLIHYLLSLDRISWLMKQK